MSSRIHAQCPSEQEDNNKPKRKLFAMDRASLQMYFGKCVTNVFRKTQQKLKKQHKARPKFRSFQLQIFNVRLCKIVLSLNAFTHHDNSTNDFVDATRTVEGGSVEQNQSPEHAGEICAVANVLFANVPIECLGSREFGETAAAANTLPSVVVINAVAVEGAHLVFSAALLLAELLLLRRSHRDCPCP